MSVLCLGAASGLLLGAGSFGRVYKGRWHGMDVAVKVMEHDSATAAMVANEVKLIMSFDHDNVVKAYDFMCYVQCAEQDTGRALAKQPQSVRSSANSQQQQSGGTSDKDTKFVLEQQQQGSFSSQGQGLSREHKGSDGLSSSLQDCYVGKGGDQQHAKDTAAGSGAGGRTSAAATGGKGAHNTQAEGEGQLGAAAVRMGAGEAAAAAAAAGGGMSPVNFFVTDLGPYWTSDSHSSPSNNENLQVYSTSPLTSAAPPGDRGSAGGEAAAAARPGAASKPSTASAVAVRCAQHVAASTLLWKGALGESGKLWAMDWCVGWGSSGEAGPGRWSDAWI